MVKVILLVSKDCPYCPLAEDIWKELQKEYKFEFEEVDVNSEKGRELVKRYSIMAVPTTLVDDKIAFIGIPKKDKAMEIVKAKT